MSLHHLQLWVPDLARATRSWGWLLERLGYTRRREWATGRVWRDDTTGIVIEASPDMVPGMLYSRLRPGLNHVAFHVRDTDELRDIVEGSAAHGWTELVDHQGHPLRGELTVAFLEDQDGFEVELVAPAAPDDTDGEDGND